MGQEIATSTFTPADFERFRDRLTAETALLHQYFDTQHFIDEPLRCGLEVEAWITTPTGYPAPLNETLLSQLNHPLIGPELAKFNIEFNTTPQALDCNTLNALEQELTQNWQLASTAAKTLGMALTSIGTLPSTQMSDLISDNMSISKRYFAINQQMMRLHGGSFDLVIEGVDRFTHTCTTIMAEAATTSWQIHLQIPLERSVRYYNASLIASAAVVAIAANSPYLFGHQLWHESRIPLFEQVIANPQGLNRVTFGQNYAHHSLFECFLSNLNDYAVLLPITFDTPAEHFSHLNLHNGTIWRWNRPIIGVSPGEAPHIRLEHRVMAAPTTLADGIASTAFFLGLTQALATTPEPPEALLPFAQARANFYAAARQGLAAQVMWLDHQSHVLQSLMLSTLLPLAEQGLAALNLPTHYLTAIAKRCQTGQTGATWQQRFIAREGKDFAQLVRCYHQHQVTNALIHTWSLP